MIPSTLFAFTTAMLSFVVVNGAVFQRDSTFTSLTPKPTSPSSSFSGIGTTPSPSSSAILTTPTLSSSAISVPASPSSSAPVSTTSAPSSSAVSVPPPQSSSCTPSSSVPVTTTPSPLPSAGAANCNGVQKWQASFAYNAGDRVIFNNQLFTAKQWTYDNAPPTHLDQWTAGGVCAQPINNKVSCSGVAAWQQTVAYTAGNQVTFNGHLWSAVQWVQSNSPGDTSGSWQDLGACA